MSRKPSSKDAIPQALGLAGPALLTNELIRASAGTGKTFSLVQRYLWLLEQGAEPERIAAMTFTRKAAGEFFERILQELAMRGSGTDGASAVRLLRKVVRRMDRLRLGTIDAFFMAMTQSLPFELGLTGQTGLMSEEDTEQARDEVLDALMLAISQSPDDAMLDELREAWKAASHGSEQGRPTEALAGWCTRLHQLYIECPGQDRWGAEQSIWPGGNPALALAGGDMAAAVDRLRGALDMSTFDKRAPAKWEQFFEEVTSREGGEKIGKATDYMLHEDRGQHDRLRLGGTGWKMWKVRELSRQEGTALADVLDAIIGSALLVHCQRSRAQRDVMRLYEASYHRLVRGRGRLVFSDLGWLLSGRLQTTSATDWEAMRTQLEYRMDARYDHWLLDEFQDTSERQWEVLAPLLEEARQDVERQRSVFLVGDLKQSIYLWRQAEPELFHHVERTWAGERLRITPLNESYRSCPEVLHLVNDVFLDAEAALQEMFPGVEELWTYDRHLCSSRVAKLNGHAAFLHIPAAGKEGADADADPLIDGITALIREVEPLRRGLTCAVLVRKNDTAREMSDALRARLDMEVICESQETVMVDNPATLALLSLVQLSAHPGDSKAWEHIAMTPLGAVLAQQGLTRPLLSARVRGDISLHGFLSVLRDWSQHLREALGSVDAFTARRLAQMLDFAAAFDETGSRDADDFLRRARAHTLREEAASARAIQVMTVHQSKGLQFDVVILPELQGEALDSVSRNRLFVSRGSRGRIDWILDKPEKTIIERDPVLTAELAREKARHAFEGLCRLYVSMTRAKLALYAITVKKKACVTKNEADFMNQRLATGEASEYQLGDLLCECHWDRGNRRWFDAVHPRAIFSPPTADLPIPATLGRLLRQVNASVQRRAPSGEEAFHLSGKEFASPVRETKRKQGLLVHELFAAVSWLDDIADLPGHWSAGGFNTDDPAALQSLHVLQSVAIRPWFTRGKTRREVWIERRFDLVADGGWISGILDRVVLECGPDGAFTRATIIDFKTDEIQDDTALASRAAGYRPQLELYAQAVQRLASLPPHSVHAILIFTAIARLHPVSF